MMISCCCASISAAHRAWRCINGMASSGISIGWHRAQHHSYHIAYVRRRRRALYLALWRMQASGFLASQRLWQHQINVAHLSTTIMAKKNKRLRRSNAHGVRARVKRKRRNGGRRHRHVIARTSFALAPQASRVASSAWHAAHQRAGVNNAQEKQRKQ